MPSELTPQAAAGMGMEGIPGAGPAEGGVPQMPYYTPENTVDNVLGQIDPSLIIDNLDHALKGEIFNKEKGRWELNPSGKALVNDACRGAVMSYLTGILTNNTTMAIIQEKQLSHIMESVIESIGKMFKVNLEEFGFVPPGKGYAKGEYENKGTPDTAKMTMVSNMIYSVCFFVLSRALHGMESKKIFGSLSMTDGMGYNQQQQQGGSGLFRKMFGM